MWTTEKCAPHITRETEETQTSHARILRNETHSKANSPSSRDNSASDVARARKWRTAAVRTLNSSDLRHMRLDTPRQREKISNTYVSERNRNRQLQLEAGSAPHASFRNSLQTNAAAHQKSLETYTLIRRALIAAINFLYGKSQSKGYGPHPSQITAYHCCTLLILASRRR